MAIDLPLPRVILQTEPAPPQVASGPIAELLQDFGIPFADILGATISFVVVFVVIYLLGKRVVRPVFDRILERRSLDKHARRPLKKILDFLVIFVAISAAFGAAGFGNFLQSLATIAAAATLAIGFAMQDVIKNFVAGVFIYTDKPFRIGDWIEWDGYSGVVEDISLRVTRVRTFDNELLTVPNSQLTDGVIKNPVEGDTLRLKVPFGISYGDDIANATDIILEEAASHGRILEDPEPSVRVTELGDSSVVLQARVWIANPGRSDFVRTRSEFVEAVKNRFDEEGVTIPFPNRTLEGEVDVTVAEAVEELE